MPNKDYLLDTKRGKYKILTVIKECGDLDLACNKLCITRLYLEQTLEDDEFFGKAIDLALEGIIPRFYDYLDVRSAMLNQDLEAIRLILACHRPDEWGSYEQFLKDYKYR